jgi:predicted anti-sigma-YlaC factor YlaD
VAHNFHGTDEQLEHYSLGSLSDSDLPVIEAHLLMCAACRERLNGIEDFNIAMRDALSEESALEAVALKNTESRGGWFKWGLLASLRRPAFSMALGCVALIVAMVIFSHGRTKFAPGASLQLTAMRGEMPTTIPARELDLTLSDGPRVGGPFRIEVVNAMGATMWRGAANDRPAGLQVKLMQSLVPGDYFVRLYSADGKELREYGFRIRA